jgi:hypothetical protein
MLGIILNFAPGPSPRNYANIIMTRLVFDSVAIT